MQHTWEQSEMNTKWQKIYRANRSILWDTYARMDYDGSCDTATGLLNTAASRGLRD